MVRRAYARRWSSRPASTQDPQVVAVAANWCQGAGWITFQLVEGGLDVADDYIADHCRTGDLVVTSDIRWRRGSSSVEQPSFASG